MQRIPDTLINAEPIPWRALGKSNIRNEWPNWYTGKNLSKIRMIYPALNFFNKNLTKTRIEQNSQSTNECQFISTTVDDQRYKRIECQLDKSFWRKNDAHLTIFGVKGSVHVFQ